VQPTEAGGTWRIKGPYSAPSVEVLKNGIDLKESSGKEWVGLVWLRYWQVAGSFERDNKPLGSRFHASTTVQMTFFGLLRMLVVGLFDPWRWDSYIVPKRRWTTNIRFGFYKMWSVSWLAEELLASQEGVTSMELSGWLCCWRVHSQKLFIAYLSQFFNTVLFSVPRSWAAAAPSCRHRSGSQDLPPYGVW
jgi:hypothetical protein